MNKAAYTFAVGLLAGRVYAPMAAVMAAGMTPPLGLALACLLFRNKFDLEERTAGRTGAGARDVLHHRGCDSVRRQRSAPGDPGAYRGSAVAGAISMVRGVQLLVPHGGMFAALIPGAVTNLLPTSIAILAGTIVTAVVLFFLKRPLAEPMPALAWSYQRKTKSSTRETRP